NQAREPGREAQDRVASAPELRTDFLYDEAFVLLTLGDRGAALRLLSDYLTARPSLRGLVSKHPRWRPLWSDSTFKLFLSGPRYSAVYCTFHDVDLRVEANGN